MAHDRDDIDDTDDEPVIVGRAVLVGTAAGIAAFLIFVAHLQNVGANYSPNTWSDQPAYDRQGSEPSSDWSSAPPATTSAPDERQNEDQSTQEPPAGAPPQEDRPPNDGKGPPGERSPYPSNPSSR